MLTHHYLNPELLKDSHPHELWLTVQMNTPNSTEPVEHGLWTPLGETSWLCHSPPLCDEKAPLSVAEMWCIDRTSVSLKSWALILSPPLAVGFIFSPALRSSSRNLCSTPSFIYTVKWMILSIQLDGILQMYTPSKHQPGQDIEHSHHPRRAPGVFSQSITPQIPTLWFLTP